MGFDVDDDSDPDAGISLTYQEFLDGVARLRAVGLPDRARPRRGVAGFRRLAGNYEQAAYALAFAVDAVPALWSGPRRRSGPAIPPIRPPATRPPS